MSPKALTAALWQGPLADPAAPGRALAAEVPTRAYPEVLSQLRVLVGAALPCDAALRAACTQWPWSIDLHLLALEAAPEPDAALNALARCIEGQNRRRAAFARAAWALGQARRARHFLDRLDESSQTAQADLACRIELALRDADFPSAQADLAQMGPSSPHHASLALQSAYMTEGLTAALALMTRLPDPKPWSTAFDIFLGERAIDAAAAALSADPSPFAARRLALARDMPEAALALLQTELSAQPWDWRPGQHRHWLQARLALTQADTGAENPLAAIIAHASAACRLHARDPALWSLMLRAHEQAGNWDTVEALALTPPQPGLRGVAVTQLNRLGWHEKALTLLGEAAPEGANPAARHWLARAQTQLLAGETTAAEASVKSAHAHAPPAPTRADLALFEAELALWQRDGARAALLLAPVETSFPTRMGLWLEGARAAYFSHNPARAMRQLAQFSAFKRRQSGTAPPVDLRDRIIADACAGGRVAQAALSLRPALPRAPGQPVPRRLIHYWEGAESAPVARSLRQWATLHPQWTQHCFGRSSAENWLRQYAPDAVALFNRQALPATRADLFRILWLVQEGGVYADVDEFPRASVAPWLTGAEGVFCLESGHGTVANNFIAARSGLPLLREAATAICDTLRATETPYPWWHSGPAVLTRAVHAAMVRPDEGPRLRLLSQAEYCSCVSTNLPFPHKRGPLHWR